MNKIALLAASAAAALALGAAGQAGAATLTFDGDICGGACFDYDLISQDYGDITNQLDVIYDRDITTGGTTELSFWTTGYNELVNVAYGSNNDATGTAEIFLRPLNGLSVTLLGLDLGAWLHAELDSQLTIRNGEGGLLFSSGPTSIGTNDQSNHFSFNLTSSDGLSIQWGPSAYNVGIDNIAFRLNENSVSVPEPATWALMLVGFGAAGAVLRNRRRPFLV